MEHIIDKSKLIYNFIIWILRLIYIFFHFYELRKILVPSGPTIKIDEDQQEICSKG